MSAALQQQMDAFWGRWVTVRVNEAERTGFVRRTETRLDGVWLDLVAMDFPESSWVHINDVVRVRARGVEP